MSSHHFVKEGQEPILLILGNHFTLQQLDELVSWSPSVIIADHMKLQFDDNSWTYDADIPIDIARIFSSSNSKKLIESYIKPLLIEFNANSFTVLGLSLTECIHFLFCCDAMVSACVNNEYRVYNVQKGFTKWFSHSTITFIKLPDEGLNFEPVENNFFVSVDNGILIEKYNAKQ